MIKNIIKNMGGNWLFLLAACLVYAIIGFFNPQTALAGLRVFLHLIGRILPILGVVFALLFLFNLLIEAKTVTRYLGKGSGRGGWLIAIITGIISAGPIYLWYPLLSDLKGKGMREALIATFLYNRAVKIPLLPVMVYYFGLKPVAILTLYMILFSILNGYLVELILGERHGGKK